MSKMRNRNVVYGYLTVDNPTGKYVYVGKTNNPEARFNRHRRIAPFCRDYPNGIFVILECQIKASEIYEREKHWIKNLDTFRHGYNMTGEDGDTDPSEDENYIAWDYEVGYDTKPKLTNLELMQICEARIFHLRCDRRKNARKLIDLMFSKRRVTTSMIQDEIGIKERTAWRLLQILTELEIIEEVTGYKRNRVFSLNVRGV